MPEQTKISWLRYVWLTYWSKPVHQRWLLRAIRSQGVQNIVHVGVGDGQFASRMIDVAQRYSNQRVCYTGIDHFEGSRKGVLSLRNAHVLLKSHGAKVKLIPGDVYSAFARFANELTNTDLLLIGETDEEALQRSWLYMPRMLHDKSLVCRQNGLTLEKVDPAWINERANQRQVRRAA